MENNELNEYKQSGINAEKQKFEDWKQLYDSTSVESVRDKLILDGLRITLELVRAAKK